VIVPLASLMTDVWLPRLEPSDYFTIDVDVDVDVYVDLSHDRFVFH
jgi:hypothetical protein